MRIGVVDIGGTMIKAGVWTDGILSDRAETPSNSAGGGQAVLEAAIRILHTLEPFERIGISTAGQVDTAQGCIKYANPNIPGYTGTEIRRIVSEEFGVPVAVENDVNAAAIGEAQYGGGAGHRDFLCLTYGTGIGGAIFLHGSLYHGADFSAGEIGHLITHAEKIPGAEDPHMAGAYETHASTTALVRMASATDPSLTDGRKIFAAMDRPEIRAVVDAWIAEILCGLASLIYTFNPKLLLLGGGIMAEPYILEQIRKRLPDFVLPGHLPVEIRATQLGNHAGLMGAGYLASILHGRLHTDT